MCDPREETVHLTKVGLVTSKSTNRYWQNNLTKLFKKHFLHHFSSLFVSLNDVLQTFDTSFYNTVSWLQTTTFTIELQHFSFTWRGVPRSVIPFSSNVVKPYFNSLLFFIFYTSFTQLSSKFMTHLTKVGLVTSKSTNRCSCAHMVCDTFWCTLDLEIDTTFCPRLC